MTTHSHRSLISADVGHPLTHWVQRLQAYRARKRDIAQTWHALRKLDRATLRDIGFDRSEIGNVESFDRMMNRT